MQTIILCAGLDTRLTPITLNKPKPLLEIRGKSILEIPFCICIAQILQILSKAIEYIDYFKKFL